MYSSSRFSIAKNELVAGIGPNHCVVLNKDSQFYEKKVPYVPERHIHFSAVFVGLPVLSYSQNLVTFQLSFAFGQR